MLLGYLVVTTLIEEDRGVVAVVDDGITHHLGTLLPATVVDILLGIAGRHGLNQPETVERLDILFHRRDMHPTVEVAVTA